MATKAVPVRDLKIDDRIKTATGILQIQLKVSLTPDHCTGEARWQLYFYGTERSRTCYGSECLHRVVETVSQSSTAPLKPQLRLTSAPNS